MTLSREDMLRELELLPVWRLRAPQKALAETVQAVQPDELLVKSEVELPTIPAASLPDLVEKPAPELFAVLSDDQDYLFILEPSLSEDAEVLLQNMLRSIDIKPKTRLTGSLSQILSDCTPKLLVAMGEHAAHTLLAEPIALESLRGKVHQLEHLLVNHLSMIVTYSPSHLLDRPADKAKAWQDLCLTIATLQALS